jgi:hypothetical protein
METRAQAAPGHLPSLLCLLLAMGVLLPACSATEPDPPGVDFLVDVSGETFVLRSTHPETIRLARENLEGGNSRFPLGPLRDGDGGFNAPWTWHLDPAETRMVEVAIEVCDGRPSYVEAHEEDFDTYCPWSARVVGVLE